MTSFEEELTDLLDARAERVTVRQGGTDRGGDSIVLLETASTNDVVVALRDGRAAQENRRGRTQWLLGAAAAIVVVLGVVGLTRGSGDSDTEIAAAGATDTYRSSLVGGDIEFIVWLEPDATQPAIDAVATVLGESPLIESLPYLSQAETYAEFQEFWAQEPEVLAVVKPDALPTSFRVSMVPDAEPEAVAALVEELQGLSDVRDVEFDNRLVDSEEAAPAAASAEPLFMLPSDDSLLEGLQGAVEEPDEFGDGSLFSGVAVGRPTRTGFDQLMVVTLVNEREFTESDTVMFGDRQVFVSTDDGLVAAEPTDDGRWVHYFVNDVSTELEALVLATSVVDGELRFQPFDEVVELRRVGNLSDAGSMVAQVVRSSGPEAAGSFALSTRTWPEDIVLLTFAVSFEAVTSVEVRDQLGFQVISEDAGNPGMAVTWFEPSGHVVFLSVAAPSSAVEVAESLTVVDEATWRAAVLGPESD